MKFDFHTHHDRCGHAEGGIRDYIEAALKKGLDMIGISDHSPYFGSERDHLHPKVAMAKSEFPRYVNEVLRLKQEYSGRIEVLLGVESDFFPESAEVYRKEYERYPLDFIIGSVHAIGGMSIFNRNRWKKLNEKQRIQVKQDYYEQIILSAKSGMFDILGHIDAMKGFYPQFSELPTDAADRALKVIAEADVVIEVNTSGKTKEAGGWYPSDDVLERALFHNVKVTLGSDAHIPERVGDELELVRNRLKEIGFREWAFFRRRQRYLTKL
ncbi:histidinol-phosphatase [Ferviditalea candida]|uniref:Histidinol-phosphatase n=1 Tax=Ferviditalea candida TaxID=3108399 RepID=A0ABU5ZH85_9BACL|nr:histidinol-phosphatase [Paenibacillaceae bacterium T2]